MPTISPAIELARVRSQIDAQQQVVSFLESQLQISILGGVNLTGRQIVDEIDTIYDGIPVSGDVLAPAIQEGLDAGFDIDNEADEDTIRQLLGQSRAVLGELRIEEQGWNAEVTEEKNKRKELVDLAKG